MSQINNLLLECIKNELELDYSDQLDIKQCVKKCFKHIICLGCLDTKKILLDTESPLFLSWPIRKLVFYRDLVVD